MTFAFRAVPVLVAALAATAVNAAPTFVNGLALTATLLDLSGGTAVNTGRVGFFSDIYYDPNRSEWWALSDRGPGGGALDYATRAQRFTIDVNAATGAISNFQIQQTVLFTDAAGQALNGKAPSPASVLGGAFDPEGIVVHPKTGNLIVSDEYGASVMEFTRSGQLVRAYAIPENIRPTTAPGVSTTTPMPTAQGAASTAASKASRSARTAPSCSRCCRARWSTRAAATARSRASSSSTP